MTLMGKATEKGLEEVARAVLAPHFHREGNVSYKVCEFSIAGSSTWWVSNYKDIAAIKVHETSSSQV